MLKKVRSFGFVFTVTVKNKIKFQYCYKDKNGTNKHSRAFSSLDSCSQEFAVKFTSYIVDKIISSIKD